MRPEKFDLFPAIVLIPNIKTIGIMSLPKKIGKQFNPFIPVAAKTS